MIDEKKRFHVSDNTLAKYCIICQVSHPEFYKDLSGEKSWDGVENVDFYATTTIYEEKMAAL